MRTILVNGGGEGKSVQIPVLVRPNLSRRFSYGIHPPTPDRETLHCCGFLSSQSLLSSVFSHSLTAAATGKLVEMNVAGDGEAPTCESGSEERTKLEE